MNTSYGRRGSVASSEVCSSGVASSNCYYELSTGTTTGIQLISAAAENLFPLNLVGGGLLILIYFFYFIFFILFFYFKSLYKNFMLIRFLKNILSTSHL